MSMSIRYQKGKRNVTTKQKNTIFRSVGFADWFVKFRRNSRQKSSEKNWSGKNAVTRVHGSCLLRVFGT